MKSKKRILVAPLDWGLGHAARCVPVIRELLKNDAEVVVAAGKRPLAMLKQEFPELKFIDFPGYDIVYPGNGNMVKSMLSQIPKIMGRIKKEHRQVLQFIHEYDIHGVISDNRFGLWSKKVPSVFITHQLMVKAPFLELLIHQLNKRYIKKFTECWIPDFEGENNLSGDLAHKFKLPPNAQFIGSLSRFDPPEGGSPKKYDVMAIISGPEPQRTLFEKLVMQQLKETHLKAIVVQGKSETNDFEQVGNIKIFSHLSYEDMQSEMMSAEVVLSRSGYSTIMDLAVLGQKAALVPTPGQTEQEYLAYYHAKKKHYYAISQDQFNLEEAIKGAKKYSGLKINTSEKMKEMVQHFLRKVQSP